MKTDGVPKLDIEQYISELTINGMHGRMMHFPAPKKKNKEILLVYGHHASLERICGLAQALNRYGAVTTPDLPGFGGMDSFYSIGKKPTIDNLADYLAAFIKMRYKKRPITIIGVSFGFIIAARMLQKYPKLAPQVQLLVSAVGFLHHDDIIVPMYKQRFFSALSRFASWYVPSVVARGILRGPTIRFLYRNDSARALTPDETPEMRQYRLEFEVWLWKHNDIRTHFFTLHQMLHMNLCHLQVDLPVHHVFVDADQYLDNHLIEQHMRVVFNDFIRLPVATAKAHAPTIVANAKEAGAFIPPKLRTILNRP